MMGLSRHNSTVNWKTSIFSFISSNHGRGKNNRNCHFHWGIVLQNPTLPPLCSPKSDLSSEASSCSRKSLDLCSGCYSSALCLCTRHLTSLNLSFLFYEMEIIIKTVFFPRSRWVSNEITSECAPRAVKYRTKIKLYYYSTQSCRFHSSPTFSHSFCERNSISIGLSGVCAGRGRGGFY